MDYLLSLVGKDQETITEAIKELAENSEKVKIQEKDIDDLQSELQENREEIHYLKKKLDQKYDLIEDMEHEIGKIEENFKNAKEDLNLKDRKLKALENLITEQVEEINILMDNNLSMVNQISENVQMEKKINVQNGVIIELKEKLQDRSQNEKDQEKLEMDIEHLKRENDAKEVIIENISKENEDLRVEIENIKHVNKEEPNCLEDELGQYSRKFPCQECKMAFVSLFLLRRHMKNDHGNSDNIYKMRLKMEKLERCILEQKLDVTKKIGRLKEAENTCHCTGWCAINHLKHSWNKSSSKVLSSKFQRIIDESLPTCNICEEKFTNVNHLENHMLTHENVYHECGLCNAKFSSPEDFVVHMENNHKEADVVFLDKNLH